MGSTKTIRHVFKAHPWHGVSIGERCPDELNVYVEIVPSDTVKYELDKETGLLKVDRPQRYSNICPVHYGLAPRTHCGEKTAALFAGRTGRQGISGDGDPLDICVLTETSLTHGDVLVRAIPIGGLSMIDGDEADDKIIAIMRGDAAYGSWRDITDCPKGVLDKLKHYFLTYKQPPGDTDYRCEIAGTYGREEAHRVILASNEDYKDQYAAE
ncbi:MAG TPA: inorganic pyrophosphatase [Blastocatellia bacterium]|nr:inorganic pyrophosphatase [Blastocatellia bacterium]